MTRKVSSEMKRLLMFVHVHEDIDPDKANAEGKDRYGKPDAATIIDELSKMGYLLNEYSETNDRSEDEIVRIIMSTKGTKKDAYNKGAAAAHEVKTDKWSQTYEHMLRFLKGGDAMIVNLDRDHFFFPSNFFYLPVLSSQFGADPAMGWALAQLDMRTGGVSPVAMAHATAEDVWNNLTLSAQQESALNLLLRDLNDRFRNPDAATISAMGLAGMAGGYVDLGAVEFIEKKLKERGIENVDDINMMELIFPQYKLEDGSIRLANRLDWSADELMEAFFRDVPAGQTYATSVRRQNQEAKRAALHKMLAENDIVPSEVDIDGILFPKVESADKTITRLDRTDWSVEELFNEYMGARDQYQAKPEYIQIGNFAFYGPGFMRFSAFQHGAYMNNIEDTGFAGRSNERRLSWRIRFIPYKRKTKRNG